MNVVTRGIKNTLRSPLRSGAIVLMLAISIGLIVSMLVARSSVDAKITEVKAGTASTITVSPAGIRGGFGGGDPLTAEQVTTITKTNHVASVTSTLVDQLGTDDTNLVSSLELGNFGQRMQRFESGSGSNQPQIIAGPINDSADQADRPAPTPRTTITGTTNPDSASTSGGNLTLTSGTTIDGSSSDLVALIGTNLATKNNLQVGGTFTTFDKTITVKGIYKTGNMFEDSGVIMPLATVQALTEQPNAVTTATVHVDSSENVALTVTSLKNSLGDKADITSEADRTASSLAPLESIASLAMGGVIAATIAGAAIILLAMIMIVRERRREIGVIKAIGGTNFKVISQFVTEAMTLTVIGGIVGIGLGILVSGNVTQSLVQNQQNTNQPTIQRGPGGPGGPGGFARGISTQLSQNVQNVTSSITPAVFATAVGITILVAIIGSAIPAWFIARIRPAEVLRTE